jgi:hypothetical protein
MRAVLDGLFGEVRTYRNHIRSEYALSPAVQNGLDPLSMHTRKEKRFSQVSQNAFMTQY